MLTNENPFFFSRCSENHTKYTEGLREIILNVQSIENTLSQVIHQKVTCLADCTDQHDKLKVSIKQNDIFKILIFFASQNITPYRTLNEILRNITFQS